LLHQVPQYPLYTASIALYDGVCVGYYLDEPTAWGLDVSELERSVADAKAQGTQVVALVFINPGTKPPPPPAPPPAPIASSTNFATRM